MVNAASDPSAPAGASAACSSFGSSRPDGPVLITAGQQGTEQFDPVYNEGQTSTSRTWRWPPARRPPRSWPTTARAASRRRVTAPTPTVGTASGDFNGDGQPDLAVVSARPWTILLNNGSGGFTAGSSYTLPSGYEAKARRGRQLLRPLRRHARHRRAPGLDQHRRLLRRRVHRQRRRQLRHAGDHGGRQRRSPRGSSPDSMVAADLQRRRQDRPGLQHRRRHRRRDARQLRRLIRLGHQPLAPLGPPGHRHHRDRLQRRRQHRPGRRGQEHQRGGRLAARSWPWTCSRQRLGRVQLYLDLPDGRPARHRDARPRRRRLPGPARRASRSPCRSPTAATTNRFIDIVPLSTGGTWGGGSPPLRRRTTRVRPDAIRATSSPPTSTAPASRASRWSTATRDRSRSCWPTPTANQFLPVETITVSSTSTRSACWPSPRSWATPRPRLPRPDQRPSTLGPEQRRHLDADLPRRHRRSSSTRRARRPPRPTQRQHLHLRLCHQRRGHRRPGHDHRPGRAGHDPGL